MRAFLNPACAACLAILLVAHPVAAQQADGVAAADDLARVRTRLLEEVRVTDAAGYQLSGILIDAGTEGLILRSARGRVTVPLDSIRRVERRGDSLANGVAIGVAVGAFSGFMAGQGVSSSAEHVQVAAFAILFYTLLGAGIDALHHGWTEVPIRHRQ